MTNKLKKNKKKGDYGDSNYKKSYKNQTKRQNTIPIIINRSIYIYKLCVFLAMAAHDNNSNNNNNKEKDISHHHSDNPRKILLVDDESDITSAFDMILEMNGFEVDAYNDPFLALSNFKPPCIRRVLVE